MRVLIIEDNAEAAAAIKSAAYSAAMRDESVDDVTVLTTINDARTFLATEPRPYSILLDHDLPEFADDQDDGSGVEVAKAALKLDPNTPIVGISAVASNNVHLEHCGAFLSVPKEHAALLMPSLLRACATWRRAMEFGQNPNLPIH